MRLLAMNIKSNLLLTDQIKFIKPYYYHLSA